MTITRIGTNERMSQAVINGDTIYLSGQVAIEASGESVTQQTQNILNRIETLLEESGSNKENLQSWHRYQVFDSWRVSFLMPVLSNQFDKLNSGGYILVNINRKGIDALILENKITIKISIIY